MKTQFFEFKLTHKSIREAELVSKNESLYYRDVVLDNDQPFIIDGGAHIGLTTLYMKHLYPNAKIISFEPNPSAFRTLEKNVSSNNLSVECINAALGKKTEKSNLYGEHEGLTFGNTIIRSWTQGCEDRIDPIIVSTVKLSDYIHGPVDLLKLDIEAAEKDVLEELQQENKLQFIKNIDLEMHICKQTTNHLHDIKQLLTNNGFSFNINQEWILTQEDVAEHRKSWVQHSKPIILSCYSKNLAYENSQAQKELLTI